MSAQEVTYRALSLPLSKRRKWCIFINTSPTSERGLMLKSKKNGESLQSNSMKIYREDCFKKYSEHPKILGNTCLADLCLLYMKTGLEIDSIEK